MVEVRPMHRLRVLDASLLLLLASAWMATALPARADRVTVKGTILEGKVLRVGSKHVLFETVYGKGSIEIALGDIELLETEEPHRILHGDDDEARGRLLGLEEGALLVGDAEPALERIPVADIGWSVSEPRYQESLRERLDARWRYWDGSFSLGFSTARASSDTLNLDTGLTLTRSKGPHTLLFRTRYSLETDREAGQERRKLTNEITGLLRNTYDLSERRYVWGSTDAEYDETEALSLRLVPQTGLGYFLVKREKLRLFAESGPGYVYERFFGGDRNEYPTVKIGGGSWLDLGFGTWQTLVEYLPALDDWVDDYLLRGESTLKMPITDVISFKTTLIDTYDNTPAEGEERNEFEAILGLAFDF